MSPAPRTRHDARDQAESLGRARRPLPEHLKRQAEDDPGIFDAWQAAFDDAVAQAHADAGEPVTDSAADLARQHRRASAGSPRLAGGRPGGRTRTVAARSARQLRRGAPKAARSAEKAFEGRGSGVGIAVAMLALVLLYVLLTRSQALSALVGNVSGWLTRFLSPAHPLL